MKIFDRTMIVFRIVISVVVIVLAALQISKVWDGAICYAMPLVGVNLLVTAIQEWKQNRISSIVGLCAQCLYSFVPS